MWRVVARTVWAWWCGVALHGDNKLDVSQFLRHIFLEPRNCTIRHASGLDFQQQNLQENLDNFQNTMAKNHARSEEESCP